MRNVPLIANTRAQHSTGPRYGIPWRLACAIVASTLLGRHRSYNADAARMVRCFRPQPRVEQAECIPALGPFVLVANHYRNPGYQAWWGAAAITATLARLRPGSPEMVWMLADRWTYANPMQSRMVTPLTHWAFTRLACTYGFIPTPPVPRQEGFTEEGAQSVRRILALYGAGAVQGQPALGMAPEGRDSQDGSLIEPPPGVGRLLLHLAERGLQPLPVGVAEIDGVLTLRFGPPFALDPWPGLDKRERDRRTATQVMLAIGRLLPARLWGVYGARLEREQAAFA